ncbi:U1-C [Trypanosoma melophagium]|uniref:U1-C n=1 Tax=Trypanosoma melophagium TaxID=715481 RepID=UPI00351A579E|nr:U1-C [Trypanosoma melophagium]
MSSYPNQSTVMRDGQNMSYEEKATNIRTSLRTRAVVDLTRRGRRLFSSFKSPQTRRARLQYKRRHNERDGRLYYCDYCDLFVSSAGRSWLQHLRGVRHMECMEMYYTMVANMDSAWLDAIRENVRQSHVESYIRQHQRIAGKGAVVPIPPMITGFMGTRGIVVGGTHNVVRGQTAVNTVDQGGVGVVVGDDTLKRNNCHCNNNININKNINKDNSNVVNGSLSVRVGGFLVAEAKPPLITINGKSVPPVHLEQQLERNNNSKAIEEGKTQ